jgi:DNA repair photolyase
MGQREQLFEVARRTFDTPEFRGIEFIEVEAKTVINKVPGGGMPFEWTLNPYRGCSHACSYCVSPDTPILMADGTTRRIADLRVGDEVYGTRREGNYRRYVKTTVLNHWQTVKPAHRVTLEDGTTLVASGDHRFLTARGWKHVVGAECGPLQRPFLTTNNKLIGTGQFAIGPKFDDQYRLGYLAGMIRGDGTLGEYEYERDGRRAKIYTFRLALIDQQGLDRTENYLAQLGVETRHRLFQDKGGNTRQVFAIGTGRRAHYETIREAIRYPADPSEEWHRGFLAGIFDAEGSFAQVIRICNKDRLVLDYVMAGLRILAVPFLLEPMRADGLWNVRVIGGLKQVLRFFHLTEPAITRKRSIEGRALKSDAPLKVMSVEALGFEMPMYDITTGTGDFIADGVVSHNCFARVTHTFLDMNAGRDFDSKIVVKINAPDVLRAQLRSKRWHGDHIAMGTGTDPYQRAEGRYKLMPRIIQAMLDYKNPFSILTKGTLILRDLELLAEAARQVEVWTGFSIGTLDEDVWRRSEPGTPHPRDRIKAVGKLARAGIPVNVLMAPILPGISDRPEQMRAVIEAALDAGAHSVSPILLHLRPFVREEYMGWLAAEYPDLVPRYEAMYVKTYGPNSARNDLAKTARNVEAEVRSRLGLPTVERAMRTTPRTKVKEPEQLSLGL